MPSTYSPNLKIELIATGEQTDAWGDTTNDNFTNVFEQAITGKTIAIFPSDADYNWGAAFVNTVNSQPQRNLFVEVAGTLSTTRNFIVPTINKPYLIYNNTLGGQSIVVKTLAGTGVTVPNGQKTYVYANGTDVIESFNYFPALRAGSATLDTALPVTSGGTGSTSLTTITVGAATNIAGGAANRIPYNTGAGATSFVVAPSIASTYLQWDGSAFVWAAIPTTVGSFSAGTTGLTPNTPTTGAVVLGGTLAIANGGTGQTTANAALNALLPTQTGNAGEYLTTDGSNTSWAAIPAGTTFSAGTTGFTPNSATSGAVTLAGTLNVANGGTGQVTAQAAMNALAGAVTSGQYLRGNGTNVVMSAIQAGDVPTLNQNTTGSAAALSGGAANRIPYNTAAAATSFIAAPTIASTYLQWDGTNFAWAAVAGGVTTFSGGTTGLTPAGATSGAITLGGTLAVANGGTGVTTSTGSGSVVLSTSPTLTTPTLGAATATSINKVNITAPATAATLTIANNKTLTVNKNITFSTLLTEGYTYNLPNSNASIPGYDINNPNWTGTNDFNIGISSGGAVIRRDAGFNYGIFNGLSGDPVNPNRTSSQFNISIGQAYFNNVTSGSNNITLGSNLTCNGLTTGSNNIVLGDGSFKYAQTASLNIIIGYDNASFYSSTPFSGTRNVIIGNECAGSIRTASDYNVIIGDNAAYFLQSNSDDNVVIGRSAGVNWASTCVTNIAIGKFAVRGASGSGGIFSNHIGIGNECLYTLESNIAQNLAIGNFAGRNITTGGRNVLIGESAARDLNSGSNNTYLGFEAGKNTGVQTSNVTCIGYQAEPSATSVSNEITLGNSSIATLRCQVTTITALSDERDKKDIVDVPAGLDFINTVRPVSFVWDTRDGSKVNVPEFGFIAQQLKKTQQDTGVTVPNLVYEVSEDRLEAAPGALLPIMVKAIQELSQQVEALKKELAALRG